MVRNRVIYIILAVVCIAFSMLYTSKVTAILMVIVLLYPAVAAALTAIHLRFLSAEFDEKRITAEKNTPFEYYINIKNDSVFPCAPMEMVCVLPDVDSGMFIEKRVYVSLSPFGQARLSVEGKHLYRGCYPCSINSLAAVDPLRIIRISKKTKDECTMVFQPRRINLDDLVSASVGEQSFSRPNPITAEKEDFSHVREYRVGDIMQMIHWKLTAKQDDLMIKQFDSINDRRAIVLCDMSGEGDPLLRADTVIETAIAFVQEAMDIGIHSVVDFGMLFDRAAVQVTNITEFERFFQLMSVIPAMADTCGLTTLIDEADRSSAAVMVLITASLSPDIIVRARALSETCAVYLAYVNLSSRPVDNELYDDEFMFLDIRGEGEEALKLAAAMASKYDD